MGAAGSSGGLRGQGSLSSEAALRGQASRCLGKMLQAEGAAEGKGLWVDKDYEESHTETQAHTGTKTAT